MIIIPTSFLLIYLKTAPGFWLRTLERYNDLVKTSTTKVTRFSQYSNFQDSTLDPSTGLFKNIDFMIYYIFIIYNPY